MAEVFAAVGALDADFRDVVGAGHGRLIIHAPKHHKEVLRSVANGKGYIAVCLTEEGSGSDLRAIRTRADPKDTGYLLNGQKRFNARLPSATHGLVFASTKRPSSEAAVLTVFLVQLNHSVVNIEYFDSAGLQGAPLGTIRFQDLMLPAEARVGGEGQGFSLFQEHFTYWRTMMAAVAIGVGRSALEDTRAWLFSREAFGGPIVRFSHLQQEFAIHTSRLHMAWLLVKSAAERIDQKLPSWADAAMAKVEAVDAAIGAARWCMRVAGARGYVIDCTRHPKRLLDLAGLEIADGTPDVLRSTIARAVLGDNAYELALGTSHRIHGRSDEPHRRLW